MKTIAFYLPQFHEIPENNEWWGEGFTEWVNMKKAVPLYEGHYQPRVPLDNNYYDLKSLDTIKWQVEIARRYGIYGFCFYHYWFDGKLLLEKPVEAFLHDRSIDFHYCLCWANETWTRAWASKKDKVLIKQNYGDKEQWLKHFLYLLPFFKDNRYIMENNKPVFIIYRPEQFDRINEMIDYWNDLAIENGFDGICFIYQQVDYYLSKKNDDKFNYHIEYQPAYSFVLMSNKDIKARLRKAVSKCLRFFENIFKIEMRSKIKQNVKRYKYEDIWDFILNTYTGNKAVPCAFVDWDNTPRRGERGTVVDGASPEKFKYYFKKMVERTKTIYKKDFIFLFAWNEWAEGGYLEPDSKYGYEYLEAVKEVLDANE